MLVLFTFQATQGMDVPSYTHEKQIKNICVELKERVEETRQVKNNLKIVLDEITGYDLYYYVDDNAFGELEATRDYVLRKLAKNVKIKENPFIAVLAELKKQEDSEELETPELTEELQVIAELIELKKQQNSPELQSPELTEELQAFFSREFAIAQEDKDQEAVFSSLMNSVIKAESQVQTEVEQLSDEKEAVEPVNVGWANWIKDYWYGPSNLVSELSDDKISLDVLKKSPDMQTRINNMIAGYSPSKKRNPAMLSSLVDLYTQVDKLNFKFVDANVNSDIYNACNTWLVEEEIQYAAKRKSCVLAIAKLLTFELKKMITEEASSVETILKLEALKELTNKTGMVEVNNEEKAADISEPKVFDIVCHLEALSEELLKEESAQ